MTVVATTLSLIQVRTMLRSSFLIVLFHLAIAHAQAVTFPDDNEQKAEPETRFGLKYLGYFLSLLSTSFVGYQGVPIQTPADSTTVRPTTTLPLFSPLPSTSVASMSTAKSPIQGATVTTGGTPDVSMESAQSSTSDPESFLIGVVINAMEPSIVPEAEASPAKKPTASLTTEKGLVCGCLPLFVCTNQTKRSGLSVRIVTNPPEGIVCPSGLIYCCAPNVKYLCGLPNVIPGVNPGPNQANLGEYPWSAVILTETDSYVGGGALIGERHVLTAAHKVTAHGKGEKLKIRLGDWNLSTNKEPVSHMEIKIQSITNHPEYDPVTLRNDISVITLASPVPILTSPRPQINTICLPIAKDMFVGSRCWVAGWGKDQFNGIYQQIIKKVDVPVIGSADCQTALRGTRLGSSYVLDSKSFLCAGGEPSRDACTGDGGNALACERNGQYVIAGITVGGVECGLPNVPGLYTNVISYLPWINNVVNPPPPVTTPPPPPPPAGIDPRRKPS